MLSGVSPRVSVPMFLSRVSVFLASRSVSLSVSPLLSMSSCRFQLFSLLVVVAVAHC